jgi:hypothetical protein
MTGPTGWHPASRSAEAQAIHAAAEADRAARPERYRLDPDAALAQATRGGTVPEGDLAPGWREGLEQYLGSAAEDGRLNALGTRTVLGTAAGRLTAGAKVATAAAALPADDRLAPPIVIIGGWRTGTTFLYRLLATHSGLHAPLPAELTAPWRFAGKAAAEREALIESAAGAHDLLHVLNPTMAAVHPSGPRLAEECVLAMGTDLRNWGFTSTVRLDGYAAWLGGQDLTGSYRRYRDALRLLATGDDRRFLLKAPAHTGELAALATAFPGAVVVHLHRDIVGTVASGASLFAVFRSTYSDEVDPVDVGRFQADQTERWFRRNVEFRRSPEATAVTLVDVAYEQLVADPAAVVQLVLAAAGVEPPPDVEGFVAAYDAAQPRHAHGRHRYSPEEFGLVPDAVRERFEPLLVNPG